MALLPSLSIIIFRRAIGRDGDGFNAIVVFDLDNEDIKDETETGDNV